MKKQPQRRLVSWPKPHPVHFNSEAIPESLTEPVLPLGPLLLIYVWREGNCCLFKP